jgi:hypothetical protein
MKHLLWAHNFDYRYYYSCDYPGCTKAVNAPKKGFHMPSGWFKKRINNEEKHYCLKHYNEILKNERLSGMSKGGLVILEAIGNCGQGQKE